MRVLFATLGSLGDLHPCLALAIELKAREHAVTIASTEAYRERVVRLGLGFRALRPDWDPADPALIRYCEDLKSGPERLIRGLVLPHLEDTYRDLLAAAGDCDFMLAGEMVYAAPLVAEKLRLPWGSIILSPCSFLSAHDPSLLVTVPHLIRLRRAGWRINRAFLDLGMWLTRHWWEPVRHLRVREGLNPECAPLTRDKFSPHLVLALFPSVLGVPQPDWPASTVQTGFAFYNGDAEPGMAEELAQFLAAGEPPIVFTLGSTAVAHPGRFYEVSQDAALRLERRAVLIGARDLKVKSDRVLAVPYADYAKVFPRASIVVHQGGSGTTGQALRAGRPMLFVPFGWDQPDNALRVERLGAGLSVARKEYSVETATVALARLLRDSAFSGQAGDVARVIDAQDGMKQGCDAIESAVRLGNQAASLGIGATLPISSLR